MISVRLRKDVQELHRTFAIVQAVRDDEESGQRSSSAFEKYREALMPYSKDSVQKADDELLKRMEAEIAKGPLVVRPIAATPRVRSRLAQISNRMSRLGPLGE